MPTTQPGASQHNDGRISVNKSWLIRLAPAAAQAKPVFVRSIGPTGATTTPHLAKARRFTQAQAHSTPLQLARSMFEQNGFTAAPMEAPAA
jgi:hypothetical protein